MALPSATRFLRAAPCKTPIGVHVFRGDTIIYSQSHAGRVRDVIEADGVVYLLVVKMVNTESIAHTKTYTISDDMVLVALAHIRAVVIQKTIDKTSVVLLPVSMRFESSPPL